jgi:hypothetical protein
MHKIILILFIHKMDALADLEAELEAQLEAELEQVQIEPQNVRERLELKTEEPLSIIDAVEREENPRFLPDDQFDFFDNEEEQDDYEEGEGEQGDYGEGDEDEGHELVDERGAYERSGYQNKLYSEDEKDQFFINLEQYSLTHTTSGHFHRDFNKDNYKTLVKRYPHPRLLSPAACIAMDFFKQGESFVWNKSTYTNLSHIIRCPETVIFRYITLFNKYYFPSPR